VKAHPHGKPIRDAGEFRIRTDRVDLGGKVTIRYAGELRHMSIGRAYKKERVLLLVDDRDVRAYLQDGEYLGALRIDPAKNYQGQIS